LVEYRVVN
jgi:hypothetical protein